MLYYEMGTLHDHDHVRPLLKFSWIKLCFITCKLVSIWAFPSFQQWLFSIFRRSNML